MTILFKKVMAWILSALMGVSSLSPSKEIASDVKAEITQGIESLFGSEDVTLWDILLEMNSVFVRYFGTTQLSEDRINTAVKSMDMKTVNDAVSDTDAVSLQIDKLSRKDRKSFEGTDTAKLFSSFLTSLGLRTGSLLDSVSSVLDGKITIKDSLNTLSVSGNSATVTAKGGLASRNTNNVEIINSTDKPSTISFSYDASNYHYFSLSASSGVFSVVLKPQESFKLSIESKAMYANATLKINDFSLVPVQEKSNVKVEFNAAFGSVTVNGSSVTADSVHSITYAEGASLTATASKSGSFLGWINSGSGAIISTSATYKLNPVADVAVRAVFVGSSGVAYFRVLGGNYLFDNLANAADYAKNSGLNTVVLMNNGTMPAGDYTIPSGVTLLVPFDDANTIYTTEPAIVSDAYTTPVAYRTLTMSDGVNITVNGSICLPAKHYSAHGSRVGGASPIGNCPFIKMEKGSHITINNGGNLYAYGFITGKGTITAKSGANIYEYFQIMDFRGGSQTTNMQNGVFPLSQYYVQNIEVPLTLEAGAVENCYASVYISKMEFGSSVAFISGSGAMFNLSSGKITKRYDGTTDRLIIDVDGTIEISPIELKFGSGFLNAAIDSEEFELPINGNITVNVNSGNIILSQDIAMLPGSQINIGKNAKCTVGSNCNVYVYDSEQWGGFCGAGNKSFIPVVYAPGRTYTRKATDLVDASINVNGTFDASSGYIYTTSSGANIYSSESGKVILKNGSQSKTYQLTQSSGDSTYNEIPIINAKLKNSDGTYFSPSSSSSTNYYVDGVWKEHTGHSYTEKITVHATCDTAGTKTFTCFCGSAYIETIPASGHKAGDAATCTTNQICTVCGKDLSPALGHNYKDVTTEPTCTTDGFTTHTCQRCGDVYTDSVISAKGHTPGAEATCTNDQVCTICNTVLKPATGHNYISVVTEPTCTGNGFTTHTCENCSDSYTDSVTPAKGHNPGPDATCTEPQKCVDCGEILKPSDGHIAGAKATCTEDCICTVCGEILVPALGHDMIHEDAIDATCTEDGYSSGSHCSRCDYVEGKHIIPAKGHTPGDNATCTSDQICTVCGVVLKSATGHNYNAVITAPTCTESGFTTHTCLNCSDSYTDSVVPAKGHTAGAHATCTSSQLCSDCGTELMKPLGHLPGDEATCTEPQICIECDEIIVPAKGHTHGKEATCTTDQICTVCSVVIVSASGHKYSSIVTDPSCLDNGFTTHICEYCEDSYIDNETNAVGHSMKAATCNVPSVCSECGYSEGSALGHTVVYDSEIPSTCLQSGLSAGQHCSVCHAVIVEQQFIPASGHNIIHHEAKNPTYTEVGWEAYEECTRCDYSTYKEIPMLEEASISDYETFVENLALLEELAVSYTREVPGKDPVDLVLKYIRTGVEKYNEGSWGIMAGYEDKGFAEFVSEVEDQFNADASPEDMITISGLKNLECFTLPNGDLVDFGHMIGSMDITYYNNGSLNHADVSGWAGDLVDLLEFSDYGGVTGTLDEMIEEIGKNYLLQEDPEEIGGFNQQDMYGDLDSFFIMRKVAENEYNQGDLAKIFTEYFTEELSMEDRADYFLKNRLDGVSIRQDVRNEVYNLYTGNKLVTTLESTRYFSTDDVSTMRRACCYAFADYICELAGDYVEVVDNPCFTEFESHATTLAPGIIQNIKKATSADNKQMVYYTATADLSRDDVFVFANYKDNDPTEWGVQTVLGQATAIQNKYGNPDSDLYVENYNVIASINGGGYNMETGEPGGILVMDGKEYHSMNHNGFFGITKEGEAVLGTTEEYNANYKDKLKEAIGGFGYILIKDGKVVTDENTGDGRRASRTAVGITKTGKVVFMVLDGRQEPVSCGGTIHEIAHIMYEAGCVQAINLDGGGSTTFVSKSEGSDELAVTNKPSDGVQRSVATSLVMVSTAPSSTAFDHAIIESETAYLTKNVSLQLSASGVSATGNAAELPEGTFWSVSDSNIASVDQNGVFTALENGTTDVYLMLDDQVIGMKTMYVVEPDNIYFEKTNINAVYGQTVELPVVALYQNKRVAIKESDIVFSLDNISAGSISNFGFTGAESSGIKNVKVKAVLLNNSERACTLTVSLFNQGDMSFDFDRATGGDRQLAWYRTVSNATTEDNILYEVVDKSQPMVTDYTFAIDMTHIPIPEVLDELTDMLPGAEIEGASAWTFLLQLAERVSVLTEVRPQVTFDKNFEVDYSEVKVVNEYFTLTGTEFDEESNTLTMILNWKDQTQAIDPATANPLCILNGIKVTPKADAEWTNDTLEAVCIGKVSYTGYMRASALYGFAQKPENQVAYGVYPFINPNDPNEKGGFFGTVYAEIEDTYVLSTAIRNGWMNAEGGFEYYVDGEKLVGIKEIDGYYYDFGENGINIGQTKFTGLFYDETISAYRFSKLGELVSGWHMIGQDWYYFHSSTLAARAGYYRVGNVYYDFEETGKVVSGVWIRTLDGMQYHYGPSCHFKGWYNIDGNDYYFAGGYRYEGYKAVVSSANPTTWYDFGDDGICRGTLNGIYYIDGVYYYFEDGIATEKHLFKYGDDYYYSKYGGIIITDRTLRTASSNCDLPNATYTFGSDGKMIGSSSDGEIVCIDDVLYYYVNGVGVEHGLVKVGDDYYYSAYKGKVAFSKSINVKITNCDLPAGTYEFGADGKMLQGIVEKDGTLYYYENGKGVENGLIKHNDDYYYTVYAGRIAVNTTVKIVKTSCDLPIAKYEFGADGKMLRGIIEKDGVLYYYENGVGVEKGLIEYNGDYYYAAYKGQIALGKSVNVKITSCDLPADTYEFGADGKMLQGMIEKDGTLYYYENGKGIEKGLIKYKGAYYYTAYKGEIAVSKTINVKLTACDLPIGTYEFGADGKMLQGMIDKNGTLYYYEHGKGADKGLIKYNGAYYYTAYKGEVAVDKIVNVKLTDCDLPTGTYEFGPDGKMLDGIIEKDGVLYYYENGKGVEKGLVKCDGAYYYSAYKGQIAVSKTVNVKITNCDLPAARYEFGSDGKMLDGIIEKDGVLYYYENGQGIEKGLFELDGHYYYAAYKGELAVNKSFRVTFTNNILVADVYTFNEYGQIVA